MGWIEYFLATLKKEKSKMRKWRRELNWEESGRER